MDGGDALQQELHHLQERVGGLFGERQLPSDLPLHTEYKQHTVNTNIHGFMLIYICIQIDIKGALCNFFTGCKQTKKQSS